MSYAYQKQGNVDIRVARIFNTFGPRMHMEDGRVVSNFILQSLKNEPITIYGDGMQTRSFAYVTDLVEGLISLMTSNVTSPVNIGNPEEFQIKKFAEVIKSSIDSKSEIIHMPAVIDDPQRRRPNITKAKNMINWQPRVPMMEGLKHTITYFKNELAQEINDKANVFLPSDHHMDDWVVKVWFQSYDAKINKYQPLPEIQYK